jgi:hypothetical protein
VLSSKSHKSTVLAKRKAPSVQPPPKRLKQKQTTTRLDKDLQNNKQDSEQCRLLKVYRTERQKLEEQAKLIDEAIEAFVDELQDT